MAARADDPLDRVDEALTFASASENVRARLSGTLDLEGYRFSTPPPALLRKDEGDTLLNPRLALFLDAQLGHAFYAFAQARVDRGFDPADEPLRARLDEYALRFTPGREDGVRVQIGKFATVVGNWTARHDSWTNAFVTAPLPYENLTGVWDAEPAHSSTQLLQWAHLRPGLPAALTAREKYLRLPIIWGPSYALGAAVSGELGAWRYALEVKNGALASRPDTWSHLRSIATFPTVSGRLGWRPNPMWDFGVSASDGTYLQPGADRTLPPGHGRGDYRELVLGQDVAFAWHHLQVWSEIYATRFEIPPLGNGDTLAYYVEAKYRFTPRFSGALRWNEQFFGTIPHLAGRTPWGRDSWRIDVAPAFRLTAHLQAKLQYSLQHGNNDVAARTYAHLVAVQVTMRF